MGLSDDDVLRILKYLADSSFDELHLEVGDLKIHVNKNANADVIAPGRTETEEAASAEYTGPPATHDTDLDSAGENPVTSSLLTGRGTHEGQPAAGQDVIEEGLVAITSPMLGTFYQAPKPGEPPFVEVGTVVDEATTVCLMEVMKLFTTIKAGKPGRITRIRAEDGQLVEYNEVLFWMDPNIDLDVDHAGTKA